MAKKKALGKGLSAILESPDTDITSSDISGNYVVGAVAELAADSIETNPFQPREGFEDEALEELANSISEQGIIQPLTVRKLGYDKYQLISGERRLKAAKMAGLNKVPSYIRVANDQQMLEMALVENIQREDLNAMEIAMSYQRLMEECKLTQEKLSERVGKNRTTVTNFLRLLKLPVAIQAALRDEKISMGHARALINVKTPEDQEALLDEIVENDLSVRAVEQLVREANQGKKIGKAAGKKRTDQPLPEKYREAVNQISRHLESKVQVKRNNKGKGNVVIAFKSDDELEKILNILEEQSQNQ
ncbi:MAG: ParB/RepB/Spo0J family partition protein [Bacteroidales bacterium]|nr:ParB/RepB/Spo0J family partition protein [Bacteroidales bacterium]